ncbi:MAG TPA: energy transducer TonB [Gemmatimonadaceae bacterium]|jgi:protein TonB|nr:energy transducer TonB [Gemmatimonadaceae bacterium]
MFDNLIESRAKKQKRAGGTLTSAVIHAIVISAAVYATAHASQELEKPKAEKVEFVTVKKDEPPPPKDVPKPPPDVVMKAPPPKGFQVLTAPIKIPDVLPDIDLSKKVTNEEDFSGKGVAGGIAKGVVGGTPTPVGGDNQTYFEFQVEKPVAAQPGNSAPRYPDMLRSANVEGEVLAQFTVDTTGRAEMNTLKILKSTHDLFTNAVRAALPNMKFYPAEVGGKHVRQLVQMPFQFSLTK